MSTGFFEAPPGCKWEELESEFIDNSPFVQNAAIDTIADDDRIFALLRGSGDILGIIHYQYRHHDDYCYTGILADYVGGVVSARWHDPIDTAEWLGDLAAKRWSL